MLHSSDKFTDFAETQFYNKQTTKAQQRPSVKSTAQPPASEQNAITSASKGDHPTKVVDITTQCSEAQQDYLQIVYIVPREKRESGDRGA